MELFYNTCFIVSLALMGFYALIWHKHFPVVFTLIFAFVPIANLGTLYQVNAQNVREAVLSIKITYLGASYLILFIVLAIFDLCKLNLKAWIRYTFISITTAFFLTTLTIGIIPVFYKGIEIQEISGHFEIIKQYGILHSLYYVHIALYLLISIIVTIYSIKNKKDVSNRILAMLMFCEASTVLLFFGGRLIGKNIELLPLSYIIDEILLLFIIRRITLYNVSDTAIDTIIKNGVTGFVSFDERFNYLGSNDIAKMVFPALASLQIDECAAKNENIRETLITRINDFIADESKKSFYTELGDKIYQTDISRLFDGHKNRGFLLYIQDDTKDQKYIALIDDFNDKLRDEVAQKTKHIVEMHDQLILSMAAMVESRDNSTGGHIKRTSDVVKILIDEILKDKGSKLLKENDGQLSPEFCHNLIKAAPMHDLGKIAVDDAILRKPGKFTPEEYSIMQTHAEEGARIVHEILKDTEDNAFHQIAENVAHYHHERWDGSGYPRGLKGEEIPLESRIMAVADVYDALVSKRFYKEKMSFTHADTIMTEGFGKHFDLQLKKYYITARPRLEAYYSESQQ
ncbi:MAG: HD domain-containing protein [Treponemataceae bacterium]|nr:HD domain-containing protein [Treponemataceae bacterium]